MHDGLIVVRGVGGLIGGHPVRELATPKGVNGRSSDNRRIRSELDREPSIRLREGLERTYAWIHDEMRATGSASEA